MEQAVGAEVRQNFRYIDVSGVGNSGKSAVVDLLREVDGIYVPEYWFEFDIIRIPNGLLDLRHRLVSDWSPIRAHYAVHAFLDTVEMLGRNPEWWDLVGLSRSTARYDRRFAGEFTRCSRDFALSFVRARYFAEWYDDPHEARLVHLWRKVLRKLGMRMRLRREVMIADGDQFDAKARNYLDGLYAGIVAPGTDRVILNNGLEPYNPVPGLDMLAGAHQIVVTRDPRDVYVSGLNHHRVAAADRAFLASDNDGLNKGFLATDDLAIFVERFRTYHRHLYAGNDPRILRLRFEDFLLDHEIARARAFAFLGLDPKRHARAGQHLQPAVSAKNVGLWKHYSRRDEIEYIADALPELLYPL